MKHLDDDFKLLRNAKTKVGSKRYVELIPLGEEHSLGSWASLGNPSGSYNGLSSAVHEGKLYVGLDTSGHIFRFDGPNTWTDMGQPSGATSINTLRSYNHKLYANGPDGEVYRFDGIGNWTYVGNAGTCMVYRLEVYHNNLYAGTCGSGIVYRFDKVNTWRALGTTSAEAIRSSTIYKDKLYVGTDDGHVYEYGGAEIWSSKEETPRGAGIRSLIVFKNEMYCGVSGGTGAGHVFRYYGGMTWEDCGRLGTSSNVPALVSFGGRLYGGADDGKVYRYDGHITWTEIAHLGSGTSVNSFTKFEGRLCAAASTSSGNVYRVENQPGTVLDISSYVSKVGKATNRLEGKLNQFQPKTVSVDLMDNEFFFKSDKTGIFDYDKLRQGYQLKVSVGLTGSSQWILMFDGKVNPDSAKSIDRETAVFTATSWLDNAKDYNAELAADPDNFPFKNVTGVTFIECLEEMRIGVKKLEFNTNDDKTLSFEGGPKKIIIANGIVDLFDAAGISGIKVEVDYSLLPKGNEKDEFPIIEHEGELVACYWWENETLKFVVGKVADEIGITEKDIQVEEIEDIIGQEKGFSYWDKTVLPRGIVTAFRVVEIDEAPTPCYVKALVGITKYVGWEAHVYLLTIDYVAGTISKSLVFSLSKDYRITRFLKFGNKWWVLVSGDTKIHPNGYASPCWKAIYLKGLNSSWQVDYTFDFSTLSGSYTFVYMRSGSVLKPNASDIYFLGQYDTTGPNYYYVILFKLTWNGSILSHTQVKILESDLGTTNDVFAEEWGTLFMGFYPEHDYYYFGIRRNATPTGLEVRKCDLTTLALTTIHSPGAITGFIENFTRTTYTNSPSRQGYFIYQESDTIDKAYWIDSSGNLLEVAAAEVEIIKNMIHGNPYFPYHYMYWHYDKTNDYYYISSIYSPTAGILKEEEKLDPRYSIGSVAPEMFRSDPESGFWYFGLVTEGDKHITPFLYKTDIRVYTRTANFAGMSCKKALIGLAEAYCCAVDIYERDKMRFYFREHYNAEDTIDYDDYLKPQKRDYWKNWCDGVIVRNSKEAIKYSLGNTDPGAKVMKIDNPFVSLMGMAKIIAQWLLTFFGKRRLLFSIDVPFYVEPELLDKIVLFLKDKDGNAWRSYNTMVYETSFNVSPGDKKAHNMELKLLEIGGEVVHVKNVMPMDSNKITVET